jgi:hypothetical protein
VKLKSSIHLTKFDAGLIVVALTAFLFLVWHLTQEEQDTADTGPQIGQIVQVGPDTRKKRSDSLEWKRLKQPRGVGIGDYFSDESGVRSDFHAGTTWAPRGQTPVIRHTGNRFSLNMISASPKGNLRFMTSRKRISADLFLEFLRRLSRSILLSDGVNPLRRRVVDNFRTPQ